MENIIVVGGGLMGSSAAWQLSQYGEKVLLIEQQGSKYREGSSFGESRITRSLGPKHDIFSFLQRKTIDEVQKLLNFLNGIGKPKVHKMSDIYTTSPVTYLYNKNQESEIHQIAFKGQKDKFKRASGEAAFRKLGASLPESYVMVREHKKYSGTFNPKVLIKKLQLGIKKHGNEIRYHQKALKIVRKQGFYEVKVRNSKTGKTKVLKAKRVVIAAGGYTPSLLKKIAPYFKKLITPKKVLLTYFRINKKTYHSYTSRQKTIIRKAQPVFDQNGAMFFSMIDKIDKDGLPIFKVGGHLLQGNILDLDAVWKEQARKKEIKWALNHFVAYLRMFEIPIRKKEIELVKNCYCVYSVSKTKIPYVTPIVTKKRLIDSNMVVIGGMSGTGAKGCMTYGLLAADLLLGIDNSGKMYQKAKREMGVDRLRKELSL